MPLLHPEDARSVPHAIAAAFHVVAEERLRRRTAIQWPSESRQQRTHSMAVSTRLSPGQLSAQTSRARHALRQPGDDPHLSHRGRPNRANQKYQTIGTAIADSEAQVANSGCGQASYLVDYAKSNDPARRKSVNYGRSEEPPSIPLKQLLCPQSKKEPTDDFQDGPIFDKRHVLHNVIRVNSFVVSAAEPEAVLPAKDLPAACRKAKADFRPLAQADVEQAKTVLIEALDRLDQRLNLDGSNGQDWRSISKWPHCAINFNAPRGPTEPC